MDINIVEKILIGEFGFNASYTAEENTNNWKPMAFFKDQLDEAEAESLYQKVKGCLKERVWTVDMRPASSDPQLYDIVVARYKQAEPSSAESAIMDTYFQGKRLELFQSIDGIPFVCPGDDVYECTGIALDRFVELLSMRQAREEEEK